MSPTYYQDPARYFQNEQSRRDQQIRSMLNLFMQVQQMKQQQQQWKSRQQMEQRRMDYTEPYRRAQTERMLRPEPPEPTLEELMRKKAALTGVEATTRAEIKKRYEKPEKKIPKRVHTDLEKFFTGKFGTDWRETVTYEQYKDWRDEFQQRTRPVKPPKPTPQGKYFNLTKRVSDKISTRIKSLGRGEWTTEEIMMHIQRAGEMPRFDKNQGAIENLIKALAEIRQLEVKSFTEDLSKEELTRVKEIYSNISTIEKSGLISMDTIKESDMPPGTPTATNPQTGERMAYINGKWIKIR